MIGVASAPIYYYGFMPSIMPSVGAKIWGGGVAAYYGAGLAITSGVMLILYDLFIVLFIVFADKTYRSTFGPTKADLSDARYLRGVNLGLGLASIFLFPWAPFAIVGIPLVLNQLQKKRTLASGYGASLGVGILALVSLAALILTLIIAGSTTEYYYQSNYPNYYWDNNGNRIECEENTTFKRAVLQLAPTTSTAITTTVEATLSTTATTLSTTLSTVFSSVLEATTTTLEATPSDATFIPETTGRWWSTTGDSWATGDSWSGWGPMPSLTAVDPCENYRTGGGQYLESYYSGLNSAGGAIATSVFSIIYFAAMIAYIACADSMILKLIAPAVASSSAPSGAQIVAPCASCNAPLAFVRTGSDKVQVQCYQCKSICEFQVA